MKKLFTLFIFSIMVLSADPLSESGVTSLEVSFETGNIAVVLDYYGRIEIFAPDLDIRQIDRISLLVGGYQDSVFDYRGDAYEYEFADSLSPQADDSSTVAPYALLDTIDNSYSYSRPAYLVSYDVYGWSSSAYSIIKLNIKNIDSLYSYEAKPGFEIIPAIDREYGDEESGNEQFEYVSSGDYFRIFRDDSTSTTNVGFKYLSSSTVSLTAVPYDSGRYNQTDSLLYEKLNYGSIDASYQSDSTGAVFITSTTPTTVDTGESFDLYFAVAVGSDAASLDSAITTAEEKYNNIITGVQDDEDMVKPTGFSLSQNYPNPFNPSTVIEFEIPASQKVKLEVYDVLGRKVSTLIDEYKNAGSYKVDFNASNLASGIYFYRLTSGSYIQTKKMVLVK